MTQQLLTERRYDAVGGATIEWTPEGYALVTGAIARAGVLEYRRPDGTRRRELVTPAVLADAESRKTLAHKPISFMHPPGGTIKADTWRQYAEGEVLGEPVMNRDGIHLDGRVMLRSDRIISAVRNGIRQLSAGYDADIEMRSGVYTDPVTGAQEPYDAVQVARRYNHVAVVPAGRAGSTVALRLDAADDYAIHVDGTDDGAESSRPPGAEERSGDSGATSAETATGTTTPEETMKTRKLRIDGIDIELLVEQCDAIEAALKIRNDAADSTKVELEQVTRERDELKGEVAAIKVTAESQRLDEAEVQKRVDSRLELLDIAVGSGLKRDDVAKLSDGDVKRRVIGARFPELKLDGMTDGELAGAFRAAVADPRRNHAGEFARAAAEASASRNDAAQAVPSADDIYKRKEA